MIFSYCIRILYSILYNENNSWIFVNLGWLVKQIGLFFRVCLVGPESQKFLGRKVCQQLGGSESCDEKLAGIQKDNSFPES